MRNLKAGDVIRLVGEDRIVLIVDIEASSLRETRLGHVVLSGVARYPCMCALSSTDEGAPPAEFDIAEYSGPYMYLGNIDVFVDALHRVEGNEM